MSDNLGYTAGAGTTIAADDISSVFYQRVKIGIGADGSATDWSSSAPGPVVGAADLISVTLSLDTSAYASGDLLADTQAITGALRTSGGTAILHSVMLIDEDDQGVAMDIYILDANNSMGTENSAPSITDANARAILGTPIRISASDWFDLGGCRIAGRDGIGKVVKGNGSADLYVAVVNGTGTPTFTASGIRIRFGFLQN